MIGYRQDGKADTGGLTHQLSRRQTPIGSRRMHMQVGFQIHWTSLWIRCMLVAFVPGAVTSTTTPFKIVLPLPTERRYGILVKNLCMTSSTSSPITESTGPVIPMSVTYAVPLGKSPASIVPTCVWVPNTAVTLPSKYLPMATFSDVASA